jgi:hypothetical protein
MGEPNFLLSWLYSLQQGVLCLTSKEGIMHCCIRKDHLDPCWQEWFEGLQMIT